MHEDTKFVELVFRQLRITATGPRFGKMFSCISTNEKTAHVVGALAI